MNAIADKRDGRACARLDAHQRRALGLSNPARALMASCLRNAAIYRRRGWLSFARRSVESAGDYRYLSWQESEVLP